MAQKGRKPKLKDEHLKAAGWTNKQEVLTDQEKEWQLNGWTDPERPGSGAQYPDYFYYFKVIDGIEMRIDCVGKDFYWNGGRVKHPHQLEIIQTKGVESAYFKAKIKELPGTKPLKAKEKTGASQGKAPNIRLKGGPLDGNKRLWNTMFPLFAEQCYIDDTMSGTVLHRYKRDKEDVTLYHYMDTQ